MPYFCTDTVSSWFSAISRLVLFSAGAFTTLTLQVYFLLPFFHIILALPAFFAVMVPFFVTDATLFFDVVYLPLFSSAPFISRSILSPLEITHPDTDNFAAACTGNGTDGTAITTAAAVATPFNKCFFI